MTEPTSHALRAGALLAAGDLNGALLAAQSGLQAQADNAELWNLLGVCAARLEQLAMAEQCWRQALQCDPRTPDAHYNLGRCLMAQGQLAQAEAHFRAELAQRPEHAACQGNLGVLLEEAGRLDEAEAQYRLALRLRPQSAVHCFNLGRLLYRLRPEEAEDCLRRALACAPDDVDALNLLGQRLAERGERAEAETLLRRALALEASHAGALSNLGLLLQAQRRWAEAEACLSAAAERAPEQAQVLGNLALCLWRQGRSEEAEPLARRALALEPSDADAHQQLALALAQQGGWEEAETTLRAGLDAQPLHAGLRRNLGYLLLTQGRWGEGWPLHEARLETAPSPALSSPRWRGEALAGRRLLLWFEQGYGDALQTARYLPLLLGRGPARVIIACRPVLLPLLQAQGWPVEWLPISDLAGPWPAHDCHVFSMSLPGLLQPEPAPAPAYLRADDAGRAAWRARLPAGGRKLGLVWRGRPEHEFDHCRSLPGPEALLPLLALPGVQWLALQPELNQAERDWLRARGVPALGDELADFAASAALLAELDGLVTVDTAFGHLAGALGLPCALLLSARHADWRWGLESETTPWYPRHRLFRQSEAGDWTAPLARLASALPGDPDLKG